MSTPGSGTVNNAARNLSAAASTYANNQNQANSTGNSIVNAGLNTSGGLSPLVSKQLANQQGLTGKAFQGQAQAGLRGLTSRGMGSAPTGLESSIKNTAINNAGQAETQNVGNAFGEQNNLNNQALNYEQGQQQIYNPIAANQAALQAGAQQKQMGSTLGNVLGGLTGLATSPIGGGLGTLVSKIGSGNYGW